MTLLRRSSSCCSVLTVRTQRSYIFLTAPLNEGDTPLSYAVYSGGGVDSTQYAKAKLGWYAVRKAKLGWYAVRKGGEEYHPLKYRIYTASSQRAHGAPTTCPLRSKRPPRRWHNAHTASTQYTLLVTAERAPWRSANGRTEQQLYGLSSRYIKTNVYHPLP